jgi:hypothetical protein
MDFTPLAAAFGFPAKAALDKRVPKAAFARNADLPRELARALDAAESVVLHAALQEATTNVPPVREPDARYEEIDVLFAAAPDAKSARGLSQALHTALPNHTLVAAWGGGAWLWSCAAKRPDHNDPARQVVESVTFAAPDAQGKFLASLAWRGLPTRDLRALYAGLALRVEMAAVAGALGGFPDPGKVLSPETWRLALSAYNAAVRDAETAESRYREEVSFGAKAALHVQRVRALNSVRAALERLRATAS